MWLCIKQQHAAGLKQSVTNRQVCCCAVQAPRKFTSGVPGKMGYEDFVWFILSEEDKTTDTAMEYWFK